MNNGGEKMFPKLPKLDKNLEEKNNMSEEVFPDDLQSLDSFDEEQKKALREFISEKMPKKKEEKNIEVKQEEEGNVSKAVLVNYEFMLTTFNSKKIFGELEVLLKEGWKSVV